MWLGEQITERGLGNGISIIIFAGIAAGLPNAIGGILELVRTGAMHPLTALVICVLGRGCYCDSLSSSNAASASILVNYAKRQVGNKIYGGQTSHPAAQAEHGWRYSADFCLVDHPVPGHAGGLVWFRRIPAVAEGSSPPRLSPGQPMYVLFYAAAIIFFCFFYTALVFNTKGNFG